MANQRIVVCGAGIIGASIADALTRAGSPPLIVERAEPAVAASGRAAGFIALDWNDDNPMGELARASFGLHLEFAERFGHEAIGFRPLEALMVAVADNADVSPYRNVAQPDWLDGNVAAHSMIGTTATCAQVDPARLTRALVDAAVTGGATLRTGVVEEVLRDDAGAAAGVVVDGDPVTADVVVLALGPWTGRVRGVALPDVGWRKGASITLAAEIPPHAIFSDYVRTDGRRFSPEIYARPDGEVYVNGIHESPPLPDDPFAIEPEPGHCDELHRIAGLHSSTLANAAVTGRRACFRPATVDGVPLIGPVPGAAGVYVATGHGPWGILNGPATGRMVAQMILDGGSQIADARPFDPARLPATG